MILFFSDSLYWVVWIFFLAAPKNLVRKNAGNKQIGNSRTHSQRFLLSTFLKYRKLLFNKHYIIQVHQLICIIRAFDGPGQLIKCSAIVPEI